VPCARVSVELDRAARETERRFEECDRVQLKGKAEEVRLYAPVALGAGDYSTTPAATRAAATSE